MVEVVRQCVHLLDIDAVLRKIHHELLWGGCNLPQYQENMDWFPHLKHEPEVKALVDDLPEHWKTGTLCDPQILLGFPFISRDYPEITYHLDQEPPWADGRKYLRIVGVPLSPWRRINGALIVKDPRPRSIQLDPCGAVMMTPDVEHSPGINRTGAIRYSVYFRWLEG